MSVNRADLIKRLASSAAIGTRDAEMVLTTVLEKIGDGLAQGKRMEMRGFGVFERREHKARTARNSKSGETVMVDAKATVHFKAGNAMHKLLNGDPEAKARFLAIRENKRRIRDEKEGQLNLF